MKKYISIILVTLVLTSVTCISTAFVVYKQNERTEAGEHPRIRKAIHELEDAIEYLEKAPHDFGGYKAAALEDSKRAVKSLRMALEYRAAVDRKK
jgi:hypothetical protein